MHNVVGGVPNLLKNIDYSEYDFVCFFNAKYDLHVLQRWEILQPSTLGRRLWDAQVAHFLLRGQTPMYPSLDDACEHYGIPGKKAMDWSVDTPDIPEATMFEYLEQDLRSTYAVVMKQVEEFKVYQKLYNLFMLDMDDLLVLQEMEWNGSKLNVEQCIKERDETIARMASIEKQLGNSCPNTPINWDSVDHVSAFLYGGTIKVDRKELAGVFKSGTKVGEARYRWVEELYPLPRLIEPPEGSELKKEGVWSTAEDVLKTVKQTEAVKLLLERAELSKLLDYLQGLPELIETKDWTPGVLHGQFNQVVARTGRLSSSNPNLQNLPDPVLALIETRYANI